MTDDVPAIGMTTTDNYVEEAMFRPEVCRHSMLGLVAGASLLAAMSTGAAAAETLNWVTYKPKAANDPQAITTQWFADELERRTNGEYKIRIHWGGSVAKMNEIPTTLERGLGDIGDVVTPIFPDQLLVNNAISYFWPQPNSSVELAMLMAEWYDTVPQFAEEMKKYNMKVVGFRPLEEYGMMCKKPVKSVADIKDLRLRAYGFALPALVNALGAVPVSMTTVETYEALERGIVDCAPVGVTLAAGYKFDEVAGYYVELPLGASWGHLISMNLDKYNSLPETVQKEIESIGREYLVRFILEMKKGDAAVRKRWTESGKVEILPFPAAEFAKVAATDPGIKAIQEEWVRRAKEKGVDTAPIVGALTFK